jgi:hypothetical protein
MTLVAGPLPASQFVQPQSTKAKNQASPPVHRLHQSIAANQLSQKHGKSFATGQDGFSSLSRLIQFESKYKSGSRTMTRRA